MKLSGKVAIVTGGGTGIGRGIALKFAKAGVDVVVASRRLPLLEKVAEEVRALGRRSLAVQTDVSKKTDVDNLVQKAMDEFGVIDILVNNAAGGTGHRAPIVEMTEEDWDVGIDITLKGVFSCTQAVLRHMMKRRYGKIINIASLSGRGRTHIGDGYYGPAKAGVIQLTKVAAMEAGPYGIYVNCIAPGYIVTEKTFTPERKKGAEKYDRDVKKQTVLGRAGKPEDIANLALFLASDEASFITGQLICCDGGRTDISS